jgi:hypothetical protein
MAAIPGGVRFTGFVSPSDTADTYAVIDNIYGKGGYREVANNTERDAITVPRRREGMMVYVQDVHKFYYLLGGIDNINWTEFTGGGVSFPVTVDQGGTGLVAVPSGRILFGNDSTTLASSSNLSWDATNQQLSVPGLVLSVTTPGTITQGKLEFNGTDLFFSTSPTVRKKVLTITTPMPTYSIVNWDALRSIDAKDLNIDQIGNILGTLINDLRSAGLIT